MKWWTWCIFLSKNLIAMTMLCCKNNLIEKRKSHNMICQTLWDLTIDMLKKKLKIEKLVKLFKN